MSAAPDQQQVPSGPGVYVPGPAGWVPAPPGHVPPVAWIPTEQGWVAAPPGWVPPAWWVWTPSGFLPPPAPQPQQLPPAQPYPAWSGGDGAPGGGTRGMGWTRVLPRTLQRAAERGDRKPSGWEIVVVLAVFPLDAVVSAVVSLAQTLSDYSDGSAHAPTIVPDDPILSTILFTAAALVSFVPALLVWYLLKVSGGGLRAIGLDLNHRKADLARSAKIILYAYVGPILVLAGLLTNLTPHHELAGQDSSHLPIGYLIPFIISSIGAGVVEEFVVLGFLVHRLEQRGWTGWKLYAVCIAVRLSYHLYYGVPVIGFALWGGLSVMLYRRRRRLLSFIVAHAIWDSSAFVTNYLHGSYALIPFGVEILALLGLWLYGRQDAVEEMNESGRALQRRQDELPEPAR